MLAPMLEPRAIIRHNGSCWSPIDFNWPTYFSSFVIIGHFRVPSGLCFKTRVGAQPLIWKSFFILMQIKLIFTRKVKYLASFLK